MSQIAIKDMTYYYDDYYHPVFEHVNLLLDSDWKTGLIGRNGRGKTTLLKLLLGELQPSIGKIELHEKKIGYFPYVCDDRYGITMDVIKENIAGLKTMDVQMEKLILDNDSDHMETYFQLHDQYKQLDGYEMESRIYKEFEQMQLDQSLLERNYATLSGGERTCMQIIALFLRKEAFVLLDEPTNHLDQQKKLTLSKYLKKKKGFILVTHDTEFLDQVVDHILAINKVNLSLEKYPFASHARTNGTQAYMRQAKRAEEQIESNLEQ